MNEKIFSDKNIHNENTEAKENIRPIPCERTSIGDIDELIFPDDEPYYISER